MICLLTWLDSIHAATMVSDARTALEMLREGGEEQFDLVITDVHMPDMDGFKLLELIDGLASHQYN